jgi:hypothetical protein
MSYNSNIPLGTDAMTISQGQIYSNYNAMNSVWSQNHVSLTSLANQGMHNSLTFREQTGSPPDPNTSATQVSLYTKAVSGIPELFFRPNSNQTPIQLTYPSIQTGLQTITPPVYYPQQYTFMAGPFVVYGGVLNAVSSGTVVVLSPTSTLLYAQATIIGGAGKVIAVISGSSITFYPQGVNPVNLYYFAVGK